MTVITTRVCSQNTSMFMIHQCVQIDCLQTFIRYAPSLPSSLPLFPSSPLPQNNIALPFNQLHTAATRPIKTLEKTEMKRCHSFALRSLINFDSDWSVSHFNDQADTSIHSLVFPQVNSNTIAFNSINSFLSPPLPSFSFPFFPFFPFFFFFFFSFFSHNHPRVKIPMKTKTSSFFRL